MSYTAWLIELRPSVVQVPTYYGRERDRELGWTKDASRALHFCRCEDAKAVIDDIGWSEADPVEHQFG